ncbi:MAG: hypothetical protein RL885_31830 [Planctomycetota bacterium]
MRLRLWIIALLACLGCLARAGTIYVDAGNPNCPGSGSLPDPFCKIQDGINAAQPGDTVCVNRGTYVENLDFLGKAIRVVATYGPAQTIIDGNQAAPVVTFQNGETLASSLEGFTITNGSTPFGGAGIFISGASPTILGNTIAANRSTGSGGGVGCVSGSQAVLRQNRILSNYCNRAGAGVYVVGSSPRIESNWIEGNYGAQIGGGIGMYQATPTIQCNVIIANQTFFGGGGIGVESSSTAVAQSNTISGNTAPNGGSLFVGFSSSLTAINGIYWSNNGAGETYRSASGTLSISYSDVSGGYPGSGNLNVSPSFRNAAAGDYRLDCTSPCVDAGTAVKPPGLPTFDQEQLDLRAIGRIDMGADEMGLLWDLTGPPVVGGAPIAFRARAGSAQNGFRAEVFLSFQTGSLLNPLIIPNSGRRILDLDPHGLFNLWLNLPPVLRQVPSLNGCAGATTGLAVSLPAIVPVGINVHAAGFSWDPSTGAIPSVTSPITIVTQ